MSMGTLRGPGSCHQTNVRPLNPPSRLGGEGPPGVASALFFPALSLLRKGWQFIAPDCLEELQWAMVLKALLEQMLPPSHCPTCHSTLNLRLSNSQGDTSSCHQARDSVRELEPVGLLGARTWRETLVSQHWLPGLNDLSPGAAKSPHMGTSA